MIILFSETKGIIPQFISQEILQMKVGFTEKIYLSRSSGTRIFSRGIIIQSKVLGSRQTDRIHSIINPCYIRSIIRSKITRTIVLPGQSRKPVKSFYFIGSIERYTFPVTQIKVIQFNLRRHHSHQNQIFNNNTTSFCSGQEHFQVRSIILFSRGHSYIKFLSIISESGIPSFRFYQHPVGSDTIGISKTVKAGSKYPDIIKCQ